MDDCDARRQFEDLIRATWGDGAPQDEPTDSPDVPGRAFLRRPDGHWLDRESGAPLPDDESRELESRWREWAPKLPEAVRRAIEGSPRDDGGEAGDREPRTPIPSAPAAAEAVDLPDDQPPD